MILQPKSLQLVKIQLLTAANFGTDAGRVTLDSPTQLDADLHLPFLPNSALRGILKDACRHIRGIKNSVEDIFGLSDGDDPDSPRENKPGQLILGNGELLCFPFTSADGHYYWIFPLTQILKALAWQCFWGDEIKVAQIAGRIATQEEQGINTALALATRGIPQVEAPFTIKALNTDSDEEYLKVSRLWQILRHWCSHWLPSESMLVVTDRRTSSFFWQQAADIRTQTALNPARTALPGSLRRKETIPDGSLFFSLVSWMGDTAIDLSALQNVALQAGSDEAVGSGFLRLAPLPEVREKDLESAAKIDAPKGSGFIDTSAAQPPAATMTQVYKQFERRLKVIREKENAALPRKFRAAINSFGWRWQREGAETALAFSLAKACYRQREETAERLAHRWLLEIVLNKDAPARESLPFDFQEPISQEMHRDVMERWQWLRRFAEFELLPQKEEDHHDVP